MKVRTKLNPHLRWKHVAPEHLQLESLRVAVIGGTGGIGQALSRFLNSKGADVTVVGQTYREDSGSAIKFIKANLELMSEAKRVARELLSQPYDLYIFSAGIVAATEREETLEGFERDLAVSYLNRMVILRTILPELDKMHTNELKRPRVFIMGNPGAGMLGSPNDLNSERRYSALQAHSNTVAGNEALVFDCATRYPNVSVFGLNPGFIKTNIRNNLLGAGTWKSRIVEGFIGYWFQDADTYAKHIGPLLVTPDIDTHSPAFFNSKGQAIYSQGFTKHHVEWVIAKSEELLQKNDVLYSRADPKFGLSLAPDWQNS
ncbi:LAME_0A07998g1_1 [Lachancea meyersii CBS 8951]|uniref:LAME_0A07998g1_1 n=1 Tax=Lachancea meyersii CBS 8951 TaxID=1266667 RepID=A0A1G4IRA3_9SACH|nr:LAME_0A07998g1_1 [Lachancea meyersii CBS 8951]